MRWGVFVILGMRHVIPIGDIREHAQKMNCWCEPRMQTSIANDFLVVIHNSADCREFDEMFQAPKVG